MRLWAGQLVGSIVIAFNRIKQVEIGHLLRMIRLKNGANQLVQKSSKKIINGGYYDLQISYKSYPTPTKGCVTHYLVHHSTNHK